MTKNKKISADFTSSFGAIEPKRKHRNERISRDGQFGKKKHAQNYLLCYEIRYEIINSKKLAKI